MLIMLYRNNSKLAKGIGLYRSTNATSTLCAHITHEGHEHYRDYPEMCEKNNIKAVAKSPEVKEGDSCSVQSDISSFMIKTPQVHPWDWEGLLSHLCKWIVLNNQVCSSLYIMSCILIYHFQSFSVVEKELFKVLLNYQWPSTHHDIPS